MGWFEATIVFAIVWWLVLFMVLPFGAHPQDDPVPGSAPSAPEKPRLGIKFLITTGIAVILTAGIAWVIQSGLISLRPPA